MSGTDSKSPREEAIEGIMRRTGKTREQAEAFLAVLGSAFARRGWVDGTPMSEEGIGHNVDVFLGKPEAGPIPPCSKEHR